MKLLKRKLLFTLASDIDFFSKGEGFQYWPYSFLYQRISRFKKSSVRNGVLQLVATGQVDKIIRNKTPLFRLTSRGRDRLLSFFPISIGQKKVWDRKWRIAIINNRFSTTNLKLFRKLRKGLLRLGFKQFSRGVYLNPLPVSDLLSKFLLEEDLTAAVTVIESRRLLIGDNKQLAKQLWQLDGLVKEYNFLIKRLEVMLASIRKKKILSNQVKIAISLLYDSFFSLLESDPGLPKKLLPNDWPADSARELFLKLTETIENLENP